MKPTVVVIVLASLLLTACTAITLVENKRQSLPGPYSVDPQVPWSRIKANSGGELWTVDGPLLQALRFLPPLADGDTLDTGSGTSHDKRPKFRAGMTASEVEELVTHTLSESGAVDMQSEGLRPFDFGGHRGFRFDLRMRTADGLALDGLVAGAEVDGKLLLILYTGTRTHYFPKMQPTVEAVLASLQVGG